jgi:hypothetical protein
MLILGASILGATALGAQAPKAAPIAKTATAQTKDTAPGDYVGGEVCATCHEEVGKKFADNPHTKMAQMHGSNGATCENCHGAGKAHVEGGGDVTKIFTFKDASTKEITDRCLTCHAGAPNI